jgi:hypothetical protein
MQATLIDYRQVDLQPQISQVAGAYASKNASSSNCAQ